ncbi:MAG TPA: iron chelate uptake ABC transporter family permease subunit, partial [Cytophagaceae bacterium]
VLPGVCLAFILSGNKNPVLLLIGSFLTGWISITAIDYITGKSKIKEDTAIGIILSVFFGVGILLLTYIQHSGNAEQSGLDSFLFGKAASMVQSDVYVFGIVALLVIALTFLFYKEFTLISFDRAYAQVIGFPVKRIELALTSLTVLSIVVGIQAVGVVLMSAMLITPAAAARYWTDKLKVMIILAAVLAALSGISGAYVSYLNEDMPTGPWIVIIISMIAIGSFMFGPKKGIAAKWWKQRKHAQNILEENILKAFFQLGEKDQNFFLPRSLEDILAKRKMMVAKLMKGLRRLVKQGYLNKEADGKYILTEEGKYKGQRVTKIHRLWEMYLTQYVNIAPDHVHEDAENIEHILTPELEKKLEELLQYPKVDPHDSTIPYRDV